MGERYIYSRTELNAHPKNCMFKTHLEEEWEAKRMGTLKAPITQTPAPKPSGMVSAVLKKLDPRRAGGLTRLPIPVESTGGRTSKAARMSPTKQNPSELPVLSGKKEDPRTGKPPAPPPRTKPMQLGKNTAPSSSSELKIANIPVRTSR